MPTVSDFGGHANDRGHGCAKKLRKEHVRSYRCFSCGKMTFYTHLQISRMKCAPRCSACGGTTEESAASFKRNTGVDKEMAGVVTGTTVLADCLEDPKPFECPQCFKRFRSSVAMGLHVEQSHGRKPEF